MGEIVLHLGRVETRDLIRNKCHTIVGIPVVHFTRYSSYALLLNTQW